MRARATVPGGRLHENLVVRGGATVSTYLTVLGLFVGGSLVYLTVTKFLRDRRLTHLALYDDEM